MRIFILPLSMHTTPALTGQLAFGYNVTYCDTATGTEVDTSPTLIVSGTATARDVNDAIIALALANPAANGATKRDVLIIEVTS